MSTAPNASTSIQEYDSTADQPSGTRTSRGPLLARVVLYAAMGATGLDGLFRPMSNFAQSSTAVKEVNPILRKKVRELFDEGAQEFFQDGMESNFSTSLMQMLAHEGTDAVRAIAEYLFCGNANADVASEALRSLAEVEDESTLAARWQILKHFLKDKSPLVRDGAILGFANLNDPNAMKVLSEAHAMEPIAELQKLIEQVIRQLERTE
jgi:hypothetical protein